MRAAGGGCFSSSSGLREGTTTTGNSSARLLHCWKATDSVVFGGGRSALRRAPPQLDLRAARTTRSPETTTTTGSSSSSLYNARRKGTTEYSGSGSGVVVRGGRSALSAMDALLADFILRERSLFTIRPDRSVYENFEIIGSLGKGTFASVHKVRDKTTGEVLAAKMLDLSRFGTSTRGRVAEMFANEIKYAFACSCPGVVQVRSVVRGREGYLMLQELIVGGTLWDHFQCRSDQERFLLVLQLTQSLLQMQDAKVIHRDLKPTNILRREERVWVSDFGWSETYKRANSRPHELPGTIEINPAEVHAHSDQQTEKVDNYALGLNLMLIMSGHFVCRDKTKVPEQAAQRILSTIRKIRESAPLVGFNADSWQLFLRLTESKPEKRIPLPEALRLPWFTNNLLRFADYICSMGAKHQINFIWHPLVQSVSMELVACTRGPSLTNNTSCYTPVKLSGSSVRNASTRSSVRGGSTTLRENHPSGTRREAAINGTSTYFPTTPPTTAFEAKAFRNALIEGHVQQTIHDSPRRNTYRRQTETRTTSRNKVTTTTTNAAAPLSTNRTRTSPERNSLVQHLLTERRTATPRLDSRLENNTNSRLDQGRLRGDQSLASPSSSTTSMTPQRISPLLTWKRDIVGRRVNF